MDVTEKPPTNMYRHVNLKVAKSWAKLCCISLPLSQLLKLLKNQWQQVYWMVKHCQFVWRSSGEKCYICLWNKVKASSWLVLDSGQWRVCQNRWSHKGRKVKSNLDPHCKTIWKIPAIPNTLPIEQNHTRTEKHTVEDYQSWTGLSRACTATLFTHPTIATLLNPFELKYWRFNESLLSALP